MSEDELTDDNKQLRCTPQSHKRGISDYSISIHQANIRVQEWLQHFNHMRDISPIEQDHILHKLLFECNHIHELLHKLLDAPRDQLPGDSYSLLHILHNSIDQIDRLRVSITDLRFRRDDALSYAKGQEIQRRLEQFKCSLNEVEELVNHLFEPTGSPRPETLFTDISKTQTLSASKQRRPRGSSEPNDETSDSIDLKQLFIGREQQLDLFKIYLDRWKDLIRNADLDGRSITSAPSPYNKIQGLVVLLYGHGGFGKTTLLLRYRDRILEENQQPGVSRIDVSQVIDWEFVLEGKRAIFHPQPGQEIDAFEYFKTLCGLLASKLGRKPKDFKEYQSAVKAVERARKQASGVLDRMQNDERSAPLLGGTIDALSTLIGTVAPTPFDKIISNEKVKEAAKDGAELIAQKVYAKLRDELGNQLSDYLDAPTRLGLALGHDLYTFAKNFPLLIFFDTYEEVDEGDQLLRIVMGAAGVRVGWVIAGRDNLWAGSGQRTRSIAKEYGYKDIVVADRCLTVDFSAGGVGTFTLSDVKGYFDQVCQRAHYEPPITEEQAERILNVTLGIPLAVSIAAGLYLATANLEHVTEMADSQREIVDQMVERYLLHARDDQSERLKLYGLALLRRPDLPSAVAAALKLDKEDAEINYDRELRRLHSRYSFIFTEKVQPPALHQEVRHFLRLWLREHHEMPEIEAINRRLIQKYETTLKEQEENKRYSTLKERLQDDKWVSLYLDLVEQQFWLDPGEGVRYALPFMIAAAIYRRGSNRDAANTGEFFEQQIPQQYYDWWIWAKESLIYKSTYNSSIKELTGLEGLLSVAHQRDLAFPQTLQKDVGLPLPDYQAELEAALWWLLGKAHRGKNDIEALKWFERALTRLNHEIELREEAAKTYWDIAYKLSEERKYAERIDLLSKAIELKPNYTASYNSRGIVYRNLQDYTRAIENYNSAIQLDPKYARAYYNRGLAYLWLKDTKQAIIDFNQRWKLAPTNINAAWMVIWAEMDKGRPEQETAEQMAKRLEKIAKIGGDHYIAYVCRAVADGLRSKLQKGLEGLDQVPLLRPDQEEWHAYFWKGMLCAYLGRNRRAGEVIKKALELEMPPILLTPLYWLKKDRPDFFEEFAIPLLEQYDV